MMATEGEETGGARELFNALRSGDRGVRYGIVRRMFRQTVG